MLLPAPLIAQYLVITFDFGLGMRIGYTIATTGYFAIAVLRLKLTETLPPAVEKAKVTLIEILSQYPKAVKESVTVWRKVPKSPSTSFWQSS